MTDLSDIEARLKQWAFYIINLNQGAIGYPSKNIIVTMSTSTGPREFSSRCPILKFDHSQQTDKWIQIMSRTMPHLADALHFYYTCNIPLSDIAKLLGVSKRTLYQRVHEAQLWLAGRLSMFEDAKMEAQHRQERHDR